MFIPHTEQEREEMLQAIGVRRLEDMFQDVPAALRYPQLELPEALTELETSELMSAISQENETVKDLVCFLGAGAYYHYVPAAVDMLLRRGEFYTAYTPYQAEVSQGTLQAIFEYQSLIANLTGMEACNASHYDGATATAEAVIMAVSNFRGKRCKVVLSPAVHPRYRAVARTYTQGDVHLQFAGDDPGLDPLADPETLIPLIDQNTALVVLQYPDFFGRVYDYTQLIASAHQVGALVAVAVNPTALGLLKTPGEMGADIVVGEGQPLGIPLSYGGPYLGLFATRKEYVRKIAGRLVGETIDNRGQRAYVLTLTAREQHIRREKATSNICTNVALMALATTIYLSLLGKQGFRQMADLCYQNAHYAANKIAEIPGYKLSSTTPFFHEFMVSCPRPVAEINNHLLDHGILGGYDLSTDYPSLENQMLIAVTEMIHKDEIDAFCEILEEVAND